MDTFGNCVYNLPEHGDNSSNDWRKCAVASCGKLLYGTYDQPEVGESRSFAVYVLGGVLAVTLIVPLFLVLAIYKIKKKSQSSVSIECLLGLPSLPLTSLVSPSPSSLTSLVSPRPSSMTSLVSPRPSSLTSLVSPWPSFLTSNLSGVSLAFLNDLSGVSLAFPPDLSGVSLAFPPDL
uniref:Uncharacterized protein n=1 Tax=Knipowitschia caucasica TaxID=637954 RepID=A0AAV2KLE9_KNICA